MALTPAERQKRYRQSRVGAHDGEGEKRLNAWLSSAAMLALKRLAAYEGTSQRAIIERLTLAADKEVIEAFGSNDDAFDRYLNRQKPLAGYPVQECRIRIN